MDIECQFKVVEKNWVIVREKCLELSIFKIGLIGYINVGKLIIMNILISKIQYEVDEFFVILDVIIKSIYLGGNF